MQLSRRADYAIRAVVDLASLPEGSIGITREIADRQVGTSAPVNKGEQPPIGRRRAIGVAAGPNPAG